MNDQPFCKWCRYPLEVGEVAACDQCKDYAADLGMTVDQAMEPDETGGRLIPRRIMVIMERNPLFSGPAEGREVVVKISSDTVKLRD